MADDPVKPLHRNPISSKACAAVSAGDNNAREMAATGKLVPISIQSRIGYSLFAGTTAQYLTVVNLQVNHLLRQWQKSRCLCSLPAKKRITKPILN